MIEYKRLHQIAVKMHCWIFMNTGDEQAVYDELGLTDEENADLGYGGQWLGRIPGEEQDLVDAHELMLGIWEVDDGRFN